MAKDKSLIKWAAVAAETKIHNTTMHSFKTGSYGRLTLRQISKVRAAVKADYEQTIRLLDAAVAYHESNPQPANTTPNA